MDYSLLMAIRKVDQLEEKKLGEKMDLDEKCEQDLNEHDHSHIEDFMKHKEIFHNQITQKSSIKQN